MHNSVIVFRNTALFDQMNADFYLIFRVIKNKIGTINILDMAWLKLRIDMLLPYAVSCIFSIKM